MNAADGNSSLSASWVKAMQQRSRSRPRVVCVPGTIGRDAEVEAVTGVRIEHEFESGPLAGI